jgi:hypothetical protein
MAFVIRIGDAFERDMSSGRHPETDGLTERQQYVLATLRREVSMRKHRDRRPLPGHRRRRGRGGGAKATENARGHSGHCIALRKLPDMRSVAWREAGHSMCRHHKTCTGRYWHYITSNTLAKFQW